MSEETGLEGKVAVVTGGARGIGAATAARLRRAGATVVCLVRSPVADPLPDVRYVRADVSVRDEVRAAFEDIDGVEGRVDVVVNNAGIQRLGPIGTVSLADWGAVLDTNLTGPFLVGSEAVTRMVRRGEGGAIVNIVSTAAVLGMPGRGPYCAAKAGVLGLTRVMAIEGAPAGIRVNAVAPGFTRSDFIESRLADGSLKEEWMLDRVPMGRIADPAEIAEVITAVASPAFSFVTGQTIMVDGGWSIQGISDAPERLRDLS